MPVNEAPDPNAFRDFEHAGWEINVSEYEDAFSRLTRQAIGPLLDAVDLRPGIRLLDMATGPGYVAAAAAARGAQVVGIDFSAPMVARARELNPAVEFQEGDAEGLSFPDASFDAVVMNFGILHLARPERAMSEAARVLKPRGPFCLHRVGEAGGGRRICNDPERDSIAWQPGGSIAAGAAFLPVQ